jgi:hypothetical protein
MKLLVLYKKITLNNKDEARARACHHQTETEHCSDVFCCFASMYS